VTLYNENNQRTPTKTATPAMEGTKKIRRPRKRWRYEIEVDLNGPVMETNNKQAMARDRPDCTEFVMEGSPQRSATLEEKKEEQKEKKKEKKEKREGEEREEKKKGRELEEEKK
jgi:hypothetical protein